MTPPVLLPGERIIKRERVAVARPHRPLSAAGALRSLAGGDARTPLNMIGPVRAGQTAPRSTGRGPVSEHLRLFEAIFGRDSLVCADILFPWYPGFTRRTVLELARHQGVQDVQSSEEELGRIPHEIRDPSDPVAQRITREAGWSWPYFGSVDATCSWLVIVEKAARRGPRILGSTVERRDGTTSTVRAAAEAAARWLIGRLNSSSSGYLESRPKFDGSIENQVWKDSWDAYCHRDGTPATPGTVASVEVQGLVCDALRAAARLGCADAIELRRRAAELTHRIRAEFWVDDDDGGYFALGLDRDACGRPRRIEVRASNMGHLLTSTVLDGPDRESTRLREAVAVAVTAPDMLCAAGVRTLSSREQRFRPDAYHNGNSWPWDSYVVATGLRRHGFTESAATVLRRILDGYLTTGLLPEFFSGGTGARPQVGDHVVDVVDADGRWNRISQPPQEVQAWTAAAVLAVKRRGTTASG